MNLGLVVATMLAIGAAPAPVEGPPPILPDPPRRREPKVSAHPRTEAVRAAPSGPSHRVRLPTRGHDVSSLFDEASGWEWLLKARWKRLRRALAHGAELADDHTLYAEHRAAAAAFHDAVDRFLAVVPGDS